jgi:hypothetical protein
MLGKCRYAGLCCRGLAARVRSHGLSVYAACTGRGSIPGAGRVIRQRLLDMQTPSSVAGGYVHRSKTRPMVRGPFAIPGGHRLVSGKVAISAIREASLRKKVVSSKTSGRLQCNSPLPDQLELFRLKTEAGLPVGAKRLDGPSEALERATIGPGCK